MINENEENKIDGEWILMIGMENKRGFQGVREGAEGSGGLGGPSPLSASASAPRAAAVAPPPPAASASAGPCAAERHGWWMVEVCWVGGGSGVKTVGKIGLSV